MKSCPALLDHLRKRGVIVDEESPSIFGYALRGHYPFGDKKAEFSILYVSLSKKAMLHMTFPIYRVGDEEMVASYDKFFPKEKSQWGRSTPSFRQAIVDYMRGQALCPAERRNYIGIDDEKGIVEIRLVAKGKTMGEKGFIDAYRLLQYELEAGQLHRDVLTHLFAF